jgi:hypothetical protein
LASASTSSRIDSCKKLKGRRAKARLLVCPQEVCRATLSRRQHFCRPLLGNLIFDPIPRTVALLAHAVICTVLCRALRGLPGFWSDKLGLGREANNRPIVLCCTGGRGRRNKNARRPGCILHSSQLVDVIDGWGRGSIKHGAHAGPLSLWERVHTWDQGTQLRHHLQAWKHEFQHGHRVPCTKRGTCLGPRVTLRLRDSGTALSVLSIEALYTVRYCMY